MRIVIVGAGPVGLILARLMVDADPTAEVTVVEKRAEYTREQVVNADYDTYSIIYPAQVTAKILESGGCYIHSPGAFGEFHCHKSPDQEDFVDNLYLSNSLRRFEDALRKTLPSTVKVRRTTACDLTSHSGSVVIDDGETIPYDVIVGCDGVHSQVRSELFDDPGQTVLDADGRHAMIYRFDLRGARPPTHGQGLPPKPGFGMFQNRFRGFWLDTGILVVAMFLDRDESCSGSRRHCSHLDPLFEYVNVVFDISADRLRKAMRHSPAPVHVPLSLTRARTFARRDPASGRLYFLCGDAAFNVHFFTGQGLNGGSECAVLLMACLRSREPVAVRLRQYNDALDKQANAAMNNSRSFFEEQDYARKHAETLRTSFLPDVRPNDPMFKAWKYSIETHDRSIARWWTPSPLRTALGMYLRRPGVLGTASESEFRDGGRRLFGPLFDRYIASQMHRIMNAVIFYEHRVPIPTNRRPRVDFDSLLPALGSINDHRLDDLVVLRYAPPPLAKAILKDLQQFVKNRQRKLSHRSEYGQKRPRKLESP